MSNNSVSIEWSLEQLQAVLNLVDGQLRRIDKNGYHLQQSPKYKFYDQIRLQLEQALQSKEYSSK